jgi:hypothetical protein
MKLKEIQIRVVVDPDNLILMAEVDVEEAEEVGEMLNRSVRCSNK